MSTTRSINVGLISNEHELNNRFANFNLVPELDMETTLEMALKHKNLDNVIAVQRNFGDVKDNTLPNGKVNVIAKQVIADENVLNSKGLILRKDENVLNSSGPVGTYRTDQAIDPNVIVQMKPTEDFAEMVSVDAGFAPFSPTRTFNRFASDDFGSTGLTEDMYFSSGDELRSVKTLYGKSDQISISRRYIGFGVETNLIQEQESLARSRNYAQGANLERYFEHQQRLAQIMQAFNQEMVQYVLFGDKATSNVGSLVKPITAVGDGTTIDNTTMAKDLSAMTSDELVAFARTQTTAYANGTGLNASMIANTIIMADNVLKELKQTPAKFLDATSGSITVQSQYDLLVKCFNDVLSEIGETLTIKGSQYLRASNVNAKTSEGSKNLYIFTRRRSNPLLQDGALFDLPIAPTLLNNLLPYNNQQHIKRVDIVIAQLGQVFAPRGTMHKVYKPVA